MTKKEMTEIFSAMMLVWPTAEMFRGGIQKLGPTITLWTACLPDVDFWTAQQAVIKLCRTCRWPPTIAEMKEQTDAVNHEIQSEICDAYTEARNYVQIYHGDIALAYTRMPIRSRRIIDEMGGMDMFAPPASSLFDRELFERTYERMLKRSNALTSGKSNRLSAHREEIM